MTNARGWLIFSGVLSVGAGFLAGMMFTHRSAPRAECTGVFGRIYQVGSDMFVDGAAFDFLKARADRVAKVGEWTALEFMARPSRRTIFLRKFHDGAVLKNQRGAIYAVKHTRDEVGEEKLDADVFDMFEELVWLGLLEFEGRLASWPGGVVTEQARREV